MLTGWLALSIAACGGKTMATGQSKPDASEMSDVGVSRADSAACSLPGETCAGGCIAEGGQCLAGDIPCTGQVSTLSCGESAALGLYCCMPLNPGPPIEAGGLDGATLDDGAACDLPADTCPDCIRGCVTASCASQFSTPCDEDAGYCCLFNGGEVFNGDVSDAGEVDADTLANFGFFCPDDAGATICPALPVAIFNGQNTPPEPLSVGCSYSYSYLSGSYADCTCVAVDGGTAWDCDASAGGD
jgi:hypothetical protein